MVFAASFTISGGHQRINFQVAPLITLFPVLYVLYQQTYTDAFESYVYIPSVGYVRTEQNYIFGLGIAALITALYYTLKNNFSWYSIIFGEVTENIISLVFPVTWFNSGRQWRRQKGSKKQERFDMVAAALQKMCTEIFEDAETLESLTLPELKKRAPRKLLRGRRGPLEKKEVIDAILEQHGTSGMRCAVCFSDYETGDVLRRLPCHHRFHIECVDQWILKSANDYSREPGCPMCNKGII